MKAILDICTPCKGKNSIGVRPFSCCVLFLVLLSMGLKAHADPPLFNERAWSAAELNEACREVGFGASVKAEDSMRAGVCLGEVESLSWAAQGMSKEKLRSCIPTGITRLEKLRVIVVYLDQNHVRLSEPFEVLALEALAQGWPCPPE
jgi:Rap1a immunity proteins